MKFNKDDYKSMRYPVHSIKDINKIIDLFPELNYQKEIIELRDTLIPSDKLSFSKVFKWIVLTNDKGSPFIKYYTDYKKRNTEAAIEAEFVTTQNGNLIKPYMEVLKGVGDYRGVINRAIISYCRLQNDSMFSQMTVYERYRYDANERLLDSDDAAVQKNLISNINEATKQIEEYRDRFLNYNRNESLYEDLLDEIQNYIIDLSPEELAYKRKVRDDVVTNGSPYGNYRSSDTKFSEEDLSDEEYVEMEKEMSNDTDIARKIFDAQGRSAEREHVINKQKDALEVILRDEKKKRNGRKNNK